MNKIGIYVKSIIIPVLVGVIVGVLTSSFNDYTQLQKPFLAPPSIVFPIVWSILYILMGVSYGILKSNNQTDDKINLIYYLQLGINAIWPIIFFILKWRLFAFFWIILLVIAVAIMIIKFYSKNKVAGLLQLPYLLWTLFATYLNFSFYILNK